MGYYIETPGHQVNKAYLLAEKYGAAIAGIAEPHEDTQWLKSMTRQICHKLMENFDLVVVVDNASLGFEAAAYVFDQSELDAFMRDDDQRKRWLMVFPRGLAAKLSGYTKETAA